MNPDTGDPMGVKEFCERFVEAAGKEAGASSPAHSFS